MFFPVAIFAIIFLAFWIMASWTADEVGYVLSLLTHHPVALNAFEGFVINVVLNGVIASFDIIVWLLRAVGVI